MASRIPRDVPLHHCDINGIGCDDLVEAPEGVGKFSKLDKRRYYLTAIGSATESAAILDICLRLKLTASEVHATGKEMLNRIAAMLVKLARNLEQG